ncbi:unnamed protein product, partial [Iphiclides podalirius]
MNFGEDSVPLREYIKPENLRRQLKVFGLMGEKDQLGFSKFTMFLNKTIDDLRAIKKRENTRLETVWEDSKGSDEKMAYLERILTKHKTRMRKLEKLRKALDKTLMDVLVLKQETTDIYMKAHFLAEKIREALDMENATPWGFKKLIARHHNVMAKVKGNLAKLHSYEMKYNPVYLKNEMEALSSEHHDDTTLVRLETEIRKRTLNQRWAGFDGLLMNINSLRPMNGEQPGPSSRADRRRDSDDDSDLSG